MKYIFEFVHISYNLRIWSIVGGDSNPDFSETGHIIGLQSPPTRSIPSPKFIQQILAKVLQKPEPIVIQQITEHLGTIGAIHYTQPQLNPG